MSTLTQLPTRRLPQWLRRPPGSSEKTAQIKRVLRSAGLNTVCEEARCPNIAECFGRGTATFMILGDICTRGCRFCSVETGRPLLAPAEFAGEARRLRETVKALGLKHVVVTSVARDDLEDGGASGFCEAIRQLRSLGTVTVEVLVPDFRGSTESLRAVVHERPTVFNHNLETVPRLYRRVRPGASYRRSLGLLKAVKEMNPNIITKTGVMLGLGETPDEVLQLMSDARRHEVDVFTAGQYMQPTRNHLPVEEYLRPEVFSFYEERVERMGFRHVAIGPLVRSSYRAEQFVD